MKNRHVVSAGIALVIGSAAQAGMIGPIFTLEASSRAGSAVITIDQSMLQQTARSDGTMEWTLAHPVELLSSNGAPLGTLTSASLTLTQGDATTRALGSGSVAVAFGVVNGPAASMYSITSVVENFAPALTLPTGIASAGLSITDGDGNGSTMLTGEFGDGSAYEARYNGGTAFANLLGDLSTADVFGSTTDNEYTGPAPTPIGVDVDDIQSEFKFSLTANDQAAGTSIFNVVAIPSPGAGALAGLAGLAVLRRRRS